MQNRVGRDFFSGVLPYIISLTFQETSCLALKIQYDDMSTDLVNLFLNSVNFTGSWITLDKRVSLLLLLLSIEPVEPISTATREQLKPSSLMSETREEYLSRMFSVSEKMDQFSQIKHPLSPLVWML